MNDQELLWKYADGECNAQEKAAVEARLASDADFREELEMILELQSTLTSMEPEQPSMRFTQNVMEALPKIYSPAAEEPLIMPVWKKTFWGAVAVIFGSLLVLGKMSGPKQPLALPYMDDFNRGLNSVLNFVPADLMTYFVMFLLVAVTLTLIDKFLVSNKLDLRKL